MAEPLFDTHSEFQRFRDAGFQTKQADAIVHSLHAVLMGGVATKADIEQLRADIERLESAHTVNLERLEAAQKVDFERLEAVDKSNFEQLRADIERLAVAHKVDFERLESAHTVNLERLEARMKALIAQNTATHLKWLIGTAITLTSAIIGYLHYFGGGG
ncbi:MAG: hypothetical protein OXE94_11710 [Aestuariivita sp.]|nr:hypothetical protein [Aestuariivita sp.]